MLRPHAALASSAVLGSLLGLCQGWPWGWLPAQLLLALQLALLFAPGVGAGAAALRAAAFGAAMALAGYAGFLSDLPGAAPGTLLLAGAGLVAVHALLLAACAALAVRLPASPAVHALLAWPALWCLHEALLAQGPLAMPWLRLGQLQAPYGPWAAALPLGGTLLAGLLMWWTAALLWRAVGQPAERRRALLAGLALLAVVNGLGRLTWTQASGELAAVLLQPGAAPEAADEAGTQQRMAALMSAAEAARSQLLVSPQLALRKTASALPDDYLRQLAHALDRRDSDLLLGLYVAQGDGRLQNAVLSLGSSGPQRYLKRQLFPFGEFLPAQGALRDWLAGGQPRQDTARGPADAEPLWLGGHRASLSVCFELAFPGLWRQEAATSEVLVNLSSAAAHPGALLQRQFDQQAAARALEFQKPLLHATDIGGAFALDAAGHTVARLARDATASLPVTLQARRGLTPFARVGDALALSLAVAGLVLAWLSQAGAAAQPRLRLQAQRGQVLMAGVALILMSAGLLYYMVNSGQAVTEKMRVTNAADAAAYSAGVVEARALNYDAYLNRAMVANQIAIAQMVSVGSWVRYFANAVDEVPASGTDIFFMMSPSLEGYKILAIFAATKVVLEYYTGQSANYYADYVLQYGIGPIIAVHDAVVGAMAASQGAVHANLIAGVRQKQIADDVAQAMDPQLKTQVVLASHGFDNFTKSYANNDRGRFADVTMRSRDDFSRERNWTVSAPDIPLFKKNGEMKKRAGTELVGYDEWRGMDTLELHGERFGCGKLGLSWCGDIQKPLGWAAVNIPKNNCSGSGSGSSANGYHGNAYGENRRTANKAEGEMEQPGYYCFSGLPAVRELRNVAPDAELSTGITLFVTKDHAQLRTSGGAAQAKPSGQLALFDDKPAGAKLAALARAQVFFDRISPRADGRTEIASLYNPYWRVRLVAPTAADRAWAAAQQGGLALP
ncbi:apolipoprotein N-acyltransferase [Pelomonas sp. UHG3]|uniref:Apolipoprotein N-acyltransferase n=1 Tax=Roseateles hydrophilus TaxID=2975054 RepID=A0ACC6CF73_9BURK|nr:apolipoprotein N-acyltransferase [Pelomonas sp. UHG3]MCY4747081.1 apolipoprotein N-acyltransferase [Pelomonas sp. UHG3]